MTKNTLFDESRYYLSKGNNSYFLYDSRSGNYFYEDSLIEIVNKLKELKDLPEPKMRFDESDAQVFKLNMSTICNMNCSYCFRDKKSNIVTDVKKTIKIIDTIFDDFAPGLKHYSFTLNMTSESTVEFEKIKKIKEYLEKRTSPLFNLNDFKSVLLVKDLINGIPAGLLNTKVNYSNENQMIVFLNGLLKKRNLINFFPIPEGMIIPKWEWEHYNAIDKLKEKELILFNRRFLELMFPDVINKRAGFSLFICTNGTNYSDEIVKFYDDLNMDTVCLSLDGPSAVHNKYRKFNDDTATHEQIIENITKFQKSGKKISVSTVLTPDFPYPLRLLEYFRSLNINYVDMKPIRTGNEFCFTKKSMEKLLEGYKSLFERLKNDILKNDFTLLQMLSNDICTTGIKLLLTKRRVIKRCNWNEEIVIDSKGDIYPCDYMLGNNEFIRGNIFIGLNNKEVDEDLFVYSRKNCRECWNKYLCGGTCYFNSYKSNGNIFIPDEVECMYMKGLRTLGIKFIQDLLDNKVNILVIAKKLGLNISNEISLDKTYYISNGIEKKVKGTLSRVEIEVDKMFYYLERKKIKPNKEIYISIENIEKKDINNILSVRIILPTEEYNCDMEQYNKIKNLKLSHCISGTTLSDDKSVTKLKQQIYEPVRAYRIPLSNTFWYKGAPKALFGHTNEQIEFFVQKNN